MFKVKLFVAACLLAVSSVVHGQSVKSVYSAQDVALETDPHSAFWQGAEPVYIEGDRYGKPLPSYRTEVRSRWTKDSLYLLYSCPYDELHLKPDPNTREETNRLWNWDVAELFIGSDFQHIRQYKEFEVSPQGEWVDLDIDLDHPHDEGGWKWNSGFQVAARIDREAKVWYGAMRIPFSAIDTRKPAAGHTFRANLFRCAGPTEQRVLMAWQAPMAETFHTPERFGVLELAGGR
jgi:hypothetical protein